MTGLYRLLPFLVLPAGVSYARDAILPNGHLDTAAVREAYLRWNMDFVYSALDGYYKQHPKDAAASEKTFTHLYLGAVYARQAGRRAWAEAHWRAALRLDPACNPPDPYLTPDLRDWFESLRAEVPRRPAAARLSEIAMAEMDSASSVPPPRAAGDPAPVAAPARKRLLWWALGGAAAAATGAGMLAWVQADAKPQPRRVQVDATLK